jgi:hypothetical protein
MAVLQLWPVTLLTLMFSYRPPKDNCWGHALRPQDPLKAKQRVNAFFETYFERLEPEWDNTRQLTLNLNWNASVLPNVDWPELYLQPDNQKWQKTLLILTGNRITFMMFVIPISPQEPSSYEFLKRFSADAPFKLSPKHFQVGILGKAGKLAWRKPDKAIAARLQEFIV